MLRMYTLSTCDTCRAAAKWLRSRGLAFEERAIRETPPLPEELHTMLAARKGELRALFNTAGREYRAQNLAEELPHLTVPAAVALLAANGSLVKRPFLVGEGVALVGFDADAWAAELGQR